MNKLLMLFSFCLTALLLQGCINIPLPIPPSDYQEVVVEPGHKGKILILDIDGVITSGSEQSDSWWGTSDSTVNQVAEKLAKARKDRSVRAVILRIDSPGGGVTASDIIYRSIKQYKDETNTPVYCSMLDLAASGGYYVAMAADRIYVHPTTITGSIGVIAMFPQLEGLGRKIGVSMAVIKSGELKSMGSPFHDMTEHEREVLQTTINQMYDRFVQVVDSGRSHLDEDEIRKLADGRIYTAEQAEEDGLVDGIMYLDEVIDQVRSENGLQDASVVMYRKTSRETYDSVYAKSPSIPIDARSRAPQTPASTYALLNVDAGSMAAPHQPVFQYLWMP